MQFVEEIVVDEFLPTIRSLLAGELRERGLTQSDVADVLGISQSAVSKYAHGDVTINERVANDERVSATIEELADGLSTGDVTPVQALIELEVLVRELETGGDLLAQLHEEAVPELADHGASFRVHDPESDLRTSERVVSSLRRGLRILENASGFARLIPAVGSNLVACTPDAEGIDDVAGVPGRIFDVKGRTTVPAAPEFGVSEHVATVLLAARRHGADASAAINIAYEDDLLADLTERGHVAAEFDEVDDIASSVGAAIDDQPEATVLYQTGGTGIEPLIYVLGADAESVANDVRSLL
ncbi:HTH domain protein / thiamine-phosphate synthase [Natrialba magadii ATCC 43099]|uniref:HTH domain protein / thiamine-phosphate synthase n=1 Tax=Natrialba magadii (strain ATCC 43099 / DSM 3394 / CCM 3739 / CIP 104546 / IAM 13178 / JCM 8861 / NBRC 102185 / NCIMB 2190 / MS3) TaxID=547559 RepID=D3SXM5_NATMM|nr:thiamine-phosphate synthase family protein [Natrialba magadii]ADD05974.1 HTH domain protein / thiamine-phosphate synthase [Natrialba magadii ATCC 43099]ELY30517.1 XRE family transcriptional regulator [Natrialba magadii ATCC 43099]